MLYTSMVEASERTQSTSECWPKGEAGRAPLTKAVYFKKILFWNKGRDFLSAGLRIKDQSQFLGRGATSAHLPDVDQQPSRHRHRRFFLEHFITAAKSFPPLHDRWIVGLKEQQAPSHLNDQPADPGRAYFSN